MHVEGAKIRPAQTGLPEEKKMSSRFYWDYYGGKNRTTDTPDLATLRDRILGRRHGLEATQAVPRSLPEDVIRDVLGEPWKRARRSD